jgi:hypothetical protein
MSLVLALKGIEPFLYRFEGRPISNGDPTGMLPSLTRGFRSNVATNLRPAVRYVHLWSIPTDTDGKDESGLISQIMLAAGEDDDYAKVDREVARESQDIVRLVKTGDGLPTRNSGRKFVRRIRVFKSPDVDPYLFSSGTLLPTLEETGWHSLGQFQTTTGRLNSVIEFWQTDDQVARIASRSHALSGRLVRRLSRDIPSPVTEAQEAFELAPYLP